MTTKTDSPSERVINYSVSFNWVFLSVFVLTIASAIGALYLSKGNPETEHQTKMQMDLFKLFSFAWQAGIGAIFGLLGGKASK